MFQSRRMNSSTQTALDSSQHTAADVARGIMRMFARNDIWCVSEVPLKNGRRADLMGVDAYMGERRVDMMNRK